MKLVWAILEILFWGGVIWAMLYAVVTCIRGKR